MDKRDKEKRVKLTPEDLAISWDQYREALEKYKRERKDRKGGKPPLQPSVDVDLQARAEARPDGNCPPLPAGPSPGSRSLAKGIENEDLPKTLAANG